MSSFNDRNLDRDQLIASIPYIAKQVLGEELTVEIEDQKQSKMVIIRSETKECKILLFFKKKGTTTVNPDVGQEQELSNIIAEILVDTTLIDDRSMFSFCIPGMDKDQIDYLIEYLAEDVKATILADEVKDIYRIIKFQGKQNDTLVMKIYKNGTTQFQGRPIHLYRDVTFYLSEICDASKIVQAQEQFYKIDINQVGIDTEYEALFNKSAIFLGDTIKQIILPSLSLRRVEVELSDYTLFVFPILKGLEGYIKKLFLSKGIRIDRDGIGDHLIHVQGEGSLKVAPEYRRAINCEKTCKAIEQSYHHLQIHRNTLFHVDGLIEPTRTLETRKEAEELIDKTIEIIEYSYGTLV